MDMNLQKKQNLKVVKKDQKKHRLIHRGKRLPHGQDVSYIHDNQILQKGRIEGNGILCYHCNEVVSPTMFENHAGRSSCKRPYQHIFLSDGASLHQYIYSMKCSEQTSTDVVGGSTSGINPIEEVLDSRLLIAEGPKQSACVLCRSTDYEEDEDTFSDQTSIVCQQCELEFHIGCLRERGMANLEQLPPGNWFCSVECERLNDAIKVLVARGAQKVPDSFVSKLTKLDVNPDWTIVRGSSATEGSRRLLSQALQILRDRFEPIKNRDFIKLMTYGEKEFEGVHCAMLTIKSKVVTVGLFRVLGHEMVELSFVATSRAYDGKGCLKLLLSYFEKLASSLKVAKIIVLAANDAIAMWTRKFGFLKVTPPQVRNYRAKYTALLDFDDTCLLEKEIPAGRANPTPGVETGVFPEITGFPLELDE